MENESYTIKSPLTWPYTKGRPVEAISKSPYLKVFLPLRHGPKVLKNLAPKSVS